MRILAVWIDRDRHAADQEGLGMRVFGAENGVNLDDILLPFEGFKVMGNGHQVRFRRQLVGAVSPVSVLEGAETPVPAKALSFP